MSCVSRSRFGRGRLAQFCTRYHFFAIPNGRSFPIRKKIFRKWVRLPRLTQDLETAHLWSSNLAARTLRLSLVEHTLSESCDPCPMRRGLVGAVKCYYVKHDICCEGSEQKRPITTDGTAHGFQYDEGKPCFVFCFPIPYLSAFR